MGRSSAKCPKFSTMSYILGIDKRYGLSYNFIYSTQAQNSPKKKQVSAWLDKPRQGLVRKMHVCNRFKNISKPKGEQQ